VARGTKTDSPAETVRVVPTYRSLMIAAGVDLRSVIEYAGHSSITVTVNRGRARTGGARARRLPVAGGSQVAIGAVYQSRWGFAVA
jgi:hypothetical protein